MLKKIRPDELIVGAFMVVLIVFGSYMSYRPYRAPVATSNTLFIAPVYL